MHCTSPEHVEQIDVPVLLRALQRTLHFEKEVLYTMHYALYSLSCVHQMSARFEGEMVGGMGGEDATLELDDDGVHVDENSAEVLYSVLTMHCTGAGLPAQAPPATIPYALYTVHHTHYALNRGLSDGMHGRGGRRRGRERGQEAQQEQEEAEEERARSSQSSHHRLTPT
jgi:hypothetical protein